MPESNAQASRRKSAGKKPKNQASAREVKPTPLRKWRDASGLTQKEAAARVGVSQTAWKDWEVENRVPSLAHAIAIEALTERAVRVEVFGHDAKAALELARLREASEAAQ